MEMSTNWGKKIGKIL